MIRQIVPLSSEKTIKLAAPFIFAEKVPTRRFELRIGKFALPDFFDLNGVGKWTSTCNS